MIGDIESPTPIVALRRLVPDPGLTLYAKLEWMNPFGSVKDRAAKWMLEGLEERGELGERAIVEPTSGNTGIALAAIAALMGKRMIATVPWDLSVEKNVLLRMLGAEVVRTPQPGEGEAHPMDTAIAMARALAGSSDGFVMPDQYDNPDNVRAHYETTGPEIWKQTLGEVRYVFAGFGTTGTITGVGRFLKEQDPQVRVVAIEPVRGHHISGLKNLEETAVPGILDRSVIDEVVSVDDDQTRAMIRRVCSEEALMVGPSSAAILAGALRYLKGREGVAVAVSPDSGQKAISYLAEVLRTESE
ncbi:MAG TPA: cysteine synthase family protein [Coriobacteriia bacterium]|jgi:cysteine synthase